MDFRKALLTGELPDFTCLAGTMVQEVYDTHPAIREVCNRSISGHAETLEPDIAEAMRKYGVTGDVDGAESGTVHPGGAPGIVHFGQGEGRARGGCGVHRSPAALYRDAVSAKGEHGLVWIYESANFVAVKIQNILERENRMRKTVTIFVFVFLALVVCRRHLSRRERRRIPIQPWLRWSEYLMPKDAEIALARSAAPASIADDATVMVLERQGYTTAVQGKNGFLCYVERSWAHDTDLRNSGIPKCAPPIASMPRRPAALRRSI